MSTETMTRLLPAAKPAERDMARRVDVAATVTDPSPLNVAVPPVDSAYCHPLEVSDGFPPLNPEKPVL